MGRWEKNGLGFQGRGAELVEWPLKKCVLNAAFAELKTLGVYGRAIIKSTIETRHLHFAHSFLAELKTLRVSTGPIK